MAPKKPAAKSKDKPKPNASEAAIAEEEFTPDQIAAHQLFTELWTRIATQPLEFGHGEEEAALDSLVSVFRTTRELMKKHTGATEFYPIAADFLNGRFRAFMSEWHSKREDGVLNSRDGCVIFRNELRDLQKEATKTAEQLYTIAFKGEKGAKPELYSPTQSSRLPFEADDVTFGIPPLKAPKTDDDKTLNAAFAQITEQETQEIHARRGHADTTGPVKNAVGLALSGGGIRSASFCLGIVQVLARSKLLNSVDVMSTVSGGGYTGGFLVRRASAGQLDEFARESGEDSPAIQHLRRRAKFLDMGSFARSLEFGVNMVAGMILNWAVPALLISVICFALAVLNLRYDAFWDSVHNVGYIMIGIGFGVYTFVPHSLVSFRLWSLRIFWWGGAGLLLFALIHLLGSGSVDNFFSKLWTEYPTETVLTSLGGIAALPFIGSLSTLVSSALIRRIIFSSILLIASLSVPIIYLSFGFWLYDISAVSEPQIRDWAIARPEWIKSLFGIGADSATVLPWLPHLPGIHLLWVISAFLFVVVMVALDLNATGPHWIYRYGLKKTFVNLTDDDKEPDVPLSSLNENHQAPYFLINAVANLPSSERRELRERNGDFFLFSKHFCGSPILGYQPTRAWKLGKDEVDLSTAIATSGAAVSPLMAMMTISSVRALMTFLNVRLGLWIRKPRLKGETLRGKLDFGPNKMSLSESGEVANARWIKKRPGAMQFINEMFGFGVSEKKDWQLLSDGAHLDNSAVYELLRRRCKYIVAVDASTEEKEGHFSTLLTLVRHAKIDMGIQFKFNLQDLKYNPKTDTRAAHGMLCEIEYPEGGKALMLFVKLCLTGDEDAIIKGYKKANPAFPNQSTADQYYDEHQFEAYRALGEHAMGGFLKKPFFTPEEEPDETDEKAVVYPETVEAWLKELYTVIPPSEASGTSPISEGGAQEAGKST